MMDMQTLMNSMNAIGRVTRSGYHLTLGELTAILRDSDAARSVEFDDGTPVGDEDSYRGHYSDLAFAAGSQPSNVSAVLNACERAARDTYTGYKGGDYTYDERTPLWRAEYGCTGPAIVGALTQDDKVILLTRNVH